MVIELKTFGSMCLLIVLGTASSFAEEIRDNAEVKTTEKPNFIILLTDDQGYQDLGCYGSPNIKTPRIDAMASQGIRFTDFYAQPVCGPSRKSILTGCYPLRTATSSLKERSTPHPRLESSEITIAEILQAQGYATAAYGKWDMDGRFKFASNKLLATHQGFDYYFGAPDDGMKKFLENDKRIKPLPPEIRTQRYTDKAISFIKENKHKPFFAYVAYHMPHVELAASKEFKGKSAGGLYGDVVEELDHNVGRVLDVLVEEGLDKNCLLYTSPSPRDLSTSRMPSSA